MCFNLFFHYRVVNLCDPFSFVVRGIFSSACNAKSDLPSLRVLFHITNTRYIHVYNKFIILPTGPCDQIYGSHRKVYIKSPKTRLIDHGLRLLDTVWGRLLRRCFTWFTTQRTRNSTTISLKARSQ